MNDLRNRCFRLLQQIVTLRYPRCQRCGAVPVVGHHVFGRKNLPFDTQGCLSLCLECHTWAHRNVYFAKNLLQEVIGECPFYDLEASASKIKRLRGDDLLDIATGLGKELADLRERVKEE
jgi:pyruvate-formate lyase-activating enzyme